MKAYAYLRVSGLGQVDGHGFDRQLDEITRFCDENGHQLANVFKENGVSGTSEIEDRPAFQEMLESMIDSNISDVVVESQDRLARSYAVQEQILLYLAAKEIHLHNARTGEDVTAAVLGDPMKKALVQIQGVFAELEKSQIVLKLRKARERSKEINGRCEGAKPYGYYENEKSTLLHIRSMRNGGMNFTEIAQTLNKWGVRTRRNGKWYPNTVKRIIDREDP
jgi:site-specific DNA recombinase